MNRMRDELRRDAHKDPAELEREIDATRAELRETLEELELRLSPTEILDQVMSRVRRDGGEFAGNLGQSVKENPVPALLTSIGIAWMMAANGRHHNGHSRVARASGTHESKSRIRESAGRMRERLHGAKEAAKQRGESAREGLASTRSRIADSATSVRERAQGVSTAARSAARQRAERARSGMDYLWHEQPLILGAIGLAAGAIAGAALPPTEQEDETLGAIRDRALDRAKAAGMEGAKHARERVEHAAEQAKDALAGSNEGRSSSSTSAEPVQRSPEQNRDQRIEPNAPESPSSTSSPGTSLRY